MGQHKTNPNSILKKQGKLEPRKRNLSAKEQRELMEQAWNQTKIGKASNAILALIGGNRYE